MDESEVTVMIIKGLVHIKDDVFHFHGAQPVHLDLPAEGIMAQLMKVGWSAVEAEQELEEWYMKLRVKQLARVLAERITL